MRMKKLLTFLTLLTLFFGVGWAGSYTYSLKSGSPGTWTVGSSDASTTSSDGFSFVVTDGGGNASASNIVQSAHIRIYANATMTITAPSGENITNVAITCVGTSNAGQLKVGDSNMTNTAASGAAPVYTWSGSGSNPLVVTASAQCRVNKIEITTSGGSQATTYNVNLTQTTGGTISASTTTAAEGATVTLTAIPDAGYQFTSWEVLDGDANEITVTNNQFTMPASNVEVEATFTALTPYGITVTGGTASPPTAYQGQTVTVTPTIPDGKVIDQITTTPELTLTPSGDKYTFTMPNEAVTVTITYKDAPTYTNKFERITDLTQLTVGNGERYLLVCETSGKAHKGIGDDASAIEISNHSTTLTETSDVNIFTLGQVDGKYYLEYEYNGSTYYLGHKTNSSTGDNSIQGKTSNTVLSQWAITFEDGNAVITQTANDKTYNLRAYNDDFRVYTGTSNYDVQLYKEVTQQEEVSDLYIVGQVNGNDENPIDTNEGIQLTYSQTSKTYSGDFYCTGVNNGNDSGYSFLLFSKKVPYSFSTTSDLYGAGGNGNAWTINESDLGTAIPLYATSTDNFRLSAGLYTVTVALTGAGFQYTDASVTFTRRDVTMTISPSSGYFSETQTVTMASNLTEIGGKIYYTTDGSNPSDPNSSRQEYTGAITINETTTFKAVAFVGNLYSAIVEKTYTKTPAAPVITPASCSFNEPLTVNITAEEGATIYYTIDGNTPTSSNGTQYTGSFTVSETTTVKARAYFGEVYGSVAEATYTYVEPVEPGTGNFIRVTSEDDIVAGREYIILTADYTWAMGAVDNKKKKATATQDFEISLDHSTVTAGDAVNILKLGDGNVYENNDTKYWTLTQQDGKKFLLSQGSGTDIQAQTNVASGCTDEFIINITAGTHENNYAVVSGTGGRQIWYQNNGNEAGVFGHYSNNTANNSTSYQRIFLYYRDAVKIVDLKHLCKNGVENQSYKISNDLQVAYVDVENNVLWVKDADGQSIWSTSPAADDDNFQIEVQGNTHDEQGEYDQSNWLEVHLTGNNAISFKDKVIKGGSIRGKFTSKLNPTMADVTLTTEDINTESTLTAYAPNYYMAANFFGSQNCGSSMAGEDGHGHFFFMNPKPQEFAHVVWAFYSGNNTMTMPTEHNTHEFQGTFKIDMSMNEGLSELVEGTGYNDFQAIIRLKKTTSTMLKDSKPEGTEYIVYPLNITSQTPTAINGVIVNGEVKSVKYVNVAGMVSDVPFQGVNIVVTEYSDGSRSTSKMLRK